ncbi:hypothetical protein SEA_KENREY_251 [Streptomyces phage Kenrey]|nr:hypothetical protein SEA_KENREY_251 [Streptomyces phage Kenrey]
MKKSTLCISEAVLAMLMFLPNAIVSIRYIIERNTIDPSSTAFAGAGLFFLVFFSLAAVDAHKNGQ